MSRTPPGRTTEARAQAVENANRKKKEAAAATLEWEQGRDAEAAKTAKLRALRLARDAAVTAEEAAAKAAAAAAPPGGEEEAESGRQHLRARTDGRHAARDNSRRVLFGPQSAPI